MRTTRRPTPRLLALAAASLLLAAGCSAGGDDDAEATTTTTAAGSTTTEDGGDGTTTTTEGDEPDDGPTSADLGALLPTAADLGDGWTEEPSDDDEEEDDSDIMAEQCPDVAALQDDDGDDGDEVVRSFTNDDGATVEVKLTPSARQLSADEVDEYVAAINDCGEVTETEADRTTTIAFEALADDGYGEVGLRLQGDVTVSAEGLPQDVSLSIYSLLWRDGPVGVEINGQDGIDDETYESIPVDTDVLVQLADALDPQVADLVG